MGEDMSRLFSIVVITATVIVLGGCGTEQAPAGMVIINARVIDGSGGPSQHVSVRVVADRIDAIGDIVPQENDTIVDASGLVLAPGFIDVHSHHEYNLVDIPAALAAVSQGVTTIAGGMDGGHMYPLAEYFASIESTPVAINVASFAGFGTIRGEILGDDYMRTASDDELAAMGELLQHELDAGALGLSSGLEYDPGSFSSPHEVVEMAKIAAAANGHYISHIRSEDMYFWEAIDEIINIGREAQLPVQVTHMKLALNSWWGQADRLIGILDGARAEGIDITADIYPYRAWNTSFSWLITVFPDRDVNRREGAEYVLEQMLGPEAVLLPDFKAIPEYSGMTIAEIAQLRETDPETALIDMLKADAEAEEQSSMIGFAMVEEDIETIAAWPYTVIGSDGELNGPHPRGYGAFMRFLGHYVRDRGVVSLEEGVHKLSGLSAQRIGIRDRGLIEEGYFADLVLFDPDTIIDKATFTEPHLASVGIDRVWVNGQLVWANGKVTGNRPGVVVRRPAR